MKTINKKNHGGLYIDGDIIRCRNCNEEIVIQDSGNEDDDGSPWGWLAIAAIALFGMIFLLVFLLYVLVAVAPLFGWAGVLVVSFAVVLVLGALGALNEILEETK